jgi:geranylgeranyl pyrophosphate synthase
MSSAKSRVVLVPIVKSHGKYSRRFISPVHNSQQRYLASSVLADVTIPEVVRESIKSKFLNEAAREDSRLWKANRNDNSSNIRPVKVSNDDNIDETTVEEIDSLENLNLQETTRYWPMLPIKIDSSIDPFRYAKPDLDSLSASIREDLIGTDHSVLNMAASYFFEASSDGGKKVRPMMVLLISRALADSMATSSQLSTTTTTTITKRSSEGVPFPVFPLLTNPLDWQRYDLPRAQRRLAEISEMIHTASLFHDDVIDNADTRRGKPAAHKQFGNKMAILAGDYLLARASIFLARLRNVQVVETMSTIIEHLVRGEVMQLRGTSSGDESTDRIEYYLRKNFYKTGSLMANSCKSAALLGEYPDELVDVAYRYGKHVGMAFQLVDDILDYEGTMAQLGKPSLSDLKAGLATAPVLFAAQYYPELNTMIQNKFQNDGDIERAVELVSHCPSSSPTQKSGIERTKELARVHAEYAMDAILELQPSCHRDALVQLAYAVVARTK